VNGEACARCPLEEVTLHALKNEESGRIRGDQSLATCYDNLVIVYAKLAVSRDDIVRQLVVLVARVKNLEDTEEERHAQIIAELKKTRNFKYTLSIVLGAAMLAGQVLGAFLK
jgi:hypothetical protein